MKKCHSCGFENIEGSDRCEQCLHTMVVHKIPKPVSEDRYQNALMTAPVSEMTTGQDLLVAMPNDSVAKIVATFQSQSKSCVLIYDKKKLVGIFSNRDLIRKVAGIEEDLSKIKVKDVMTVNPETVGLNDPISFVVNKMAMGGFRHVPVIAADGSPISIMTIHDVMHYLATHKKKD